MARRQRLIVRLFASLVGTLFAFSVAVAQEVPEKKPATREQPPPTQEPPAQTPPDKPATEDAPPPKPLPIKFSSAVELVDLDAAFVTLRSERSLVPVVALLVDMTKLDRTLYQTESGPIDATFRVTRPRKIKKPGPPPGTYSLRQVSGDLASKLKPSGAKSSSGAGGTSTSSGAAGNSGTPPTSKPEAPPQSTPDAPPTTTPDATPPAVTADGAPQRPDAAPAKPDAKTAAATKPPSPPADEEVLVRKVERIDDNLYRITLDGVSNGDSLTIYITSGVESLNEDVSRPVTLKVIRPAVVTETTSTTFRPDLTFVSNQKLTDGSTKSVFQIPLSVHRVSLNPRGDTNMYFKSDSLLSSSSKDAASRINLTFGTERDLDGTRTLKKLGMGKSTGVAPGAVEARFDANQRFSNVNLTVDTGLRKRIGGGRDALWDNTLRGEKSTIFGTGPFLTSRIKQDKEATPNHTGRVNLGLFTGIDVKPYKMLNSSIFPGGWEFVVSAKTWLLPFEKAAPGFKPGYFEYYFSGGLVIPLPRSLGGDRRLRISYVDGAIPTNGFIRTHSFQFQIEGFQF